MKDYTDVVIFCKCSARMNIKGKHFQQYEHSPEHRKCPNCGKMGKLWVKVVQTGDKKCTQKVNGKQSFGMK